MAKLKGHHLDHELVKLVIQVFNIHVPLEFYAEEKMKELLIECEGLDDEARRVIRMIESALDWKGRHPSLPLATENLWREDLLLRARGLERA